MAECYNVACPYCVGYQCRRTCTCDIRLEVGEYVKVVRCKDCKYWYRQADSPKKYCTEHGGYWFADDYCSRGERKDEVRE